jgi:UDP-glucose 4-epimerase
MKALVTGGAGFIGSHVADYLCKIGISVVVVDDLSGGTVENVSANIKFIKCSINNYNRLEKLFQAEKFDYVVHLAAYAAESLSHFIRRFNYQNNLIGSVNLINLSVLYNIRCFVFTSSIAVYGHHDDLVQEENIPSPADPYGIAKLSVELDLKAAYKKFGLNYIIFRPHNVYGERQNVNDRYRNVIAIFINQMLNNKPMTIFGDGEQTRCFTYIDDIISIVSESVLNVEVYNKVFNIGNGQPVSLNNLSKMLSRLMDVPHRVTYLKERNEIIHCLANHNLINKYYAASPCTPLEIGLIKMINWVKTNNRITETVPFKDIEIPFGLPEGWQA